MSKLDEIQEKLDKVQKSLDDGLEDIDESNYNPDKFNDEARREIASRFVKWYFYLLMASFLAPVIFNTLIYSISKDSSLFINLKDIVLLTTSAVGSPLGFIVGYYFKSSK
jgi:hypothetical protein